MPQADYYGDSEDTAAPSTDTPAEEKSEKGEYKTALIDSEICPGMKPGDDMVVHIEKVLDSEYLVSYSPEPADEDEEEGETETEESPASEGGNPGSMASMMY